ncbi:Glycosyl transferase family 2 [Palleronia marisminoris]|uniref:Putative glycosyltransferase EpsH n=1 Tax=Palleronia marisminoris TaxID=315423 RepID=A0A1Y5TX67_9RHOB|nr:glycosyltransferase family A protein [Palleronia marisminoris]SFH49708.1 Glycosyl transferase family 2 [Palleronia marisminoris]SLN70496.1 Putative glycosyltransferase EpsH [Palleronia marisminoris]
MGLPLEIVVPARDAAATLGACLRGIRAAGFGPDEVVVVDDGSQDATPRIAQAHGARLLHTEGGVGAAAARNQGVAETTAPVILFIDADVALHGDLRDRILRFFAGHPEHAGLIGSYDAAPPAPGTLSRVRNLLHHHTHQNAAGDVTSFWAGIGAIRRADLEEAGGFEPGHLLEDVALGMELARAGRRVRLDPDLQGSHLKRWTLRSMIRADLLYRALPWSRMLLDPANDGAAAMLNAGRAGKVSVVLAGLAALGVLAVPVVPGPALVAILIAIGLLGVQNRGFLRLVRRRLGLAASVQAVGVLWVHFLCAGMGFAWAWVERFSPRGSSSPPRPPPRGA